MLSNIAQQIAEDCSKALNELKQNTPDPSVLKSVIESKLKKMNLVTREEFDAQAAVLRRTREKIDALEKAISDLE